MRIIFFIPLLLVAIFGKAAVQDSMVNHIFHLYYNQEYGSADSLLHNNKAKIDAFYFAVLEIDMSYWKNVTGTHKPDYDAFEKTLDKYYSETIETPNQKGIQLILLSYQMRYEIKRFRLINAAFTHKKTKTLFDEFKREKRMQEFGQPELLQLYNSVFLYYDNHWKLFSGEKGNENCRQAILTMEELTLSQKEMVKTLASYFLGKTYLKYEKQPQKGIPHFQSLTKLYPKNSMFSELLNECRDKSDK